MSMADKLRRNVTQNQGKTSSEEEVRDLINSAASKSLKQFIQRVETGEVPIDNMSDFARILGIYKEVNDIDTHIEGGGGQATLPEVNLRQTRVLTDLETSGKIAKEEDDTFDVSAMTEDDVADLMREMDVAQNKENEEAF